MIAGLNEQRTGIGSRPHQIQLTANLVGISPIVEGKT
jgi:hypothetical protein